MTVHNENGRKIALMKLGFTLDPATKDQLMHLIMAGGTGAAVGGVVDSDDPLRGAMLGAAGGAGLQGLRGLGTSLAGAQMARPPSYATPFVGSAGGALTVGGAQMLRGNENG